MSNHLIIKDLESFFPNKDSLTDLLSVTRRVSEHFPEAFFGGGFIRRCLINQPTDLLSGCDVDLFFTSPESQANAVKTAMRLPNARLIQDSQLHTTVATLGEKLQLIKAEYTSTIRGLLDRFDFSMCQFAIPLGPDTVEIHTTAEAIRDTFSRRLRINNLNKPKFMMYRIEKYQQQGFTIDPDDLARIEAAAKDYALTTGDNAVY